MTEAGETTTGITAADARARPVPTYVVNELHPQTPQRMLTARRDDEGPMTGIGTGTETVCATVTETEIATSIVDETVP